VLLKHSTRRDRPAAIAATINASGKRASTITKPLAFGLSEVQMITAARRLCGRTSRRGIVATEGFEVCNAVSTAMMAVEIHSKEIAAA